jgi:hypothetical protein
MSVTRYNGSHKPDPLVVTTCETRHRSGAHALDRSGKHIDETSCTNLPLVVDATGPP